MSVEEVLVSQEHLREVSAKLIHAHEEERRRVAHEVHENLAQAFIAIQFRVETVLSEMGGSEDARIREILEPVASILQEGMESVRRIAERLRPPILDDLGVLLAVSRLCRETMRDHPGLYIRKRLEIEENEIPEAMKVTIYRILEDALYTILKHNPSGRAEIGLKRNGAVTTLTIRAHGEALGAEQLLWGGDTGGWSDPTTIGERAVLSGGAFTIARDEKGGMTLKVEWPAEKKPRRR